MASSNLVVRVVTALTAIPLLVLLLFWGPVWGFAALLFLSIGLAASEFFAMTHPGDRVAQAVGVLSTVGTGVCFYLFSSNAKVLVLLFMLVPIVGMLVPLWRLGEVQTAALRALAGVAGPFYIGVLLSTLGLMRRDLGEVGPGYVVLTLTIAWVGDTGGYFGGRFFGKTKLYELVSPKKTREGLVGVVLGALVAGAIAHFWYLPEIPLWHVLVLSAVAGVLGQLGDLVESLFKRATGIKDSGRIVPGHGGLLDRIDAVLIVGPAVYIYAIWFGANAGF